MAVKRRIAVGESQRRAGAWVVTLLWGFVVTVMHFGGLKYDIYTQYHWWDLATHSMSGVGVAALFYLLFEGRLDGRFARIVVVPAFVLGMGAGFEVYEFLFKDFWWDWSRSMYVGDTLLDLVMDVLGAAAFVGMLWLHGKLGNRDRGSTSPTVADD